ncbi:tetratricopeptide repeat protein [Streptomyces sp. NPDC029044]|uniref:tetratricopeptide repeat protein n=1 Tax=Streptomyces sp. NPDC029044 TaxID=3157198 RepID=UPI0034073EFE
MEPSDLQRVTLLCATRRFGEALRLLDRELARDPDDWAALTMRAGCLLGTGDSAGALRTANQAVAAAPDEAWCHLVKARILLAVANPGEARTSVDRAVGLDPQSPAAWALRALTIGTFLDQHRQVRMRRADRQAVKAAVDTYLRLTAGELKSQEVSDAARGLQLAEYGRAARALVRRALSDDPQSAQLVETLGALEATRGNTQGAWRGLHAAVRRDAQRASSAMEGLRTVWHGVTMLALLHLLRLSSFLAPMLVAEEVVGLSAVPRGIVGSVLMVPVLWAVLRLVPMAWGVRDTLPDLLGRRTTWYAFAPACVAAAPAVFAPRAWSAVALGAMWVAWFAAWRVLRRTHDGPASLALLRRGVAEWPHYVTRCWLFGLAGGLIMLCDLVTGGWEPLSFTVSGILVTRCALLLFGFTYQHPLLRRHWRNYLGVRSGRRTAVLCGLVLAVAWVPELPGYALLVLAAVPAWQIWGGLSYLIEYGRPDEVFLHGGRISYRVRQGPYAQRPEAWPS